MLGIFHRREFCVEFIENRQLSVLARDETTDLGEINDIAKGSQVDGLA